MNGESNTVEFKAWVQSSKYKRLVDILVKEAVGFANTSGGVILVGVEDDGTVSGCTNYDEQKIIEAIFDRTVPNLFTDIEVVIIEDKHILKITVEKTAEIISTTKG